METKFQSRRPKYLNLVKIKQPLPAIVSILHRISGVLLFFPGLPLLLYSLQQVLESPESYAQFQSVIANPIIKCGFIFLLWALVHHFCAGIRHLALDLHLGSTLEGARLGSKLVVAFSIGITVLLGVLLW